MNVAYFAVVKAVSAMIGQPLGKLLTEEDVEEAREQGSNFRMDFDDAEGLLNVHCYNADFYPKLIAAVASAMDDLRTYEIEVPRVNFQMAV